MAQTLTTAFVYDNYGRPTQTTQPDGAVTYTTYNAIGKVATQIDALGRVTRFDYDLGGRLTTTTYPDNTTETATYDADGRRVTSTDRGGRTTGYAFDAVGRLTRTTFADGTYTETVYDLAGRISTTKDALGNATTYGYDVAGRRTRVTDPLGNTTSFTYDANGNQLTVLDARGNVTGFTYDADNRRTVMTLPDTHTTSTAYDQLGRRTSEIDQAGRVTQFGYDEEGRLTSVTDAANGVTAYAYDEVGERISQTDANNHKTAFAYDKMGRQTTRTLPDGKFETKTYDLASRMISRTDFAGRTTTFVYDATDRLTSKTYPDSTSVRFTYTATGRRATAIDGRGTTTYTYDNRDRVTTLTYPDGRSLGYGYDANGNRTSLTATVGATALTTTWAYDAARRVQKATDPDGRVYTFGYDVNGNRSSLAAPNGVSTSYTYDSVNRLTNLTSVHGSTVLQSYAYTLGVTGLRTRVDESGGISRSYGYDVLYRLTNETVSGSAADYVKTFTYDPVGNRLTQVTTGTGAAGLSYSYDIRDRLVNETGISYSWDDNGNQTSRSGDAAYSWDFDDRLVKVTKADGTVVQHVYDVDENRVRTTVTPSGGLATVTDYLVDPTHGLSQVVADVDGTGSVTALYVRGEGELLAVRRGSGFESYLADGLASVRELADSAGSVSDRRTYSAFGETLSHTGTDSQPYGFAGEAFDSTSGLSYNRARWMDPRTGRFLTYDHGQPTGYVYASNSPTTFTDPSGYQTLPELTVVALAFSILAGSCAPALGTSARTTREDVENDDIKSKAIQALDSAKAGTEGGQIEYVGYVYMRGGQVMSPTKAYPGDAHTADAYAPIQSLMPGDIVVDVWHTHPKGNYFSKEDVKLALDHTGNVTKKTPYGVALFALRFLHVYAQDEPATGFKTSATGSNQSHQWFIWEYKIPSSENDRNLDRNASHVPATRISR